MGENVRATNIRYYSIINGKISRRVKKDTPGAIAREIKMGKNQGQMIYELQFDSLSGRLKDIKIEDSDYGKQAKIILTENETDYSLSMPFSGGSAGGFFKRLPNIKPEIPVEICTGILNDPKKDKPVYWLIVKQNNIKVDYYYTKEDHKGLPEWEEVMVKGKPVKDNSKELLFLENMVNNEFLPKLKKLSDVPDNSEIQEDISDLPPADDINYPSHNSTDDLPY